jgi:hypothetical protein
MFNLSTTRGGGQFQTFSSSRSGLDKERILV